MADADNDDNTLIAVDFIYYSVVPLAQAILLSKGKFFTSDRPRTSSQGIDALKNSFDIPAGNTSKILCNRLLKTQFIVCHWPLTV